MAPPVPYTRESYPKLSAFHFLMGLVFAGLFTAGLVVSGDERGHNKTPYFFPAMMQAGFHVLCLAVCLYISFHTRNSDAFVRRSSAVNKAITWYNILCNIVFFVTFIGFILTLVYGICKGSDRCYAQTKQGLNIGVAVMIAIMHVITFIAVNVIGVRARHIDCHVTRNKPTPQPKIRIRIESSDSDSSDDEKKREKARKKREEANATVVIDKKSKVGHLPFSVVSHTVLKFIQARKHAQAVAPSDSDQATKESKATQKKKIRRHMSAPLGKKVVRRHESSPAGQTLDHRPPPPSYDSVIKADQGRVTPIPTENPYALPVPMLDSRHTSHVPDNLYMETAHPEEAIVVAHPKRSKLLHKARRPVV